MKMTGLIFFLIFAQITVAFFDVFQGAVHSMHNTFGKLVTDVVSNVRHNIDCSIRSMQSVLDKDASSRFASDSDCNRQADSDAINKEANAKDLGNKKQLHKILTSESDNKTDRIDNPRLAKDLLSILNRTSTVRKLNKSLETDEITEIVKDLENNSNNTLIEIEKQIDNMKILQSIQPNEFNNIMKIPRSNSEIEKITRSIYPHYFKDTAKNTHKEKSRSLTVINRLYNNVETKILNFASTTSSPEYISADQTFVENKDESTMNLFKVEYDKHATVENDITTEHSIFKTILELNNNIDNKNNKLETSKNDNVFTPVLSGSLTSENSIVTSANIQDSSSIAKIKQTVAQKTVSDDKNDVYIHNNKEIQFIATSTDSSDKHYITNLEHHLTTIDDVSTKTTNISNDFDDMVTKNIDFKNKITTLKNIVTETVFLEPSMTDDTISDIPHEFKEILNETTYSTQKYTDTSTIKDSYRSINSGKTLDIFSALKDVSTEKSHINQITHINFITDNRREHTNSTQDLSSIMKEEHRVNPILGSQFISNNSIDIKNDSYTLSYTNTSSDLSNVFPGIPTENSNHTNATINSIVIINSNNISLDTSTTPEVPTRSKELFTVNNFLTTQFIKNNDSNINNESHPLLYMNITSDVSNISKEDITDVSLGHSPINGNEPMLESYTSSTKTDTTLDLLSNVPTEKSLFMDQIGTMYENLTMTKLNTLNITEVTLDSSTVLPELSIESSVPTIQTVTINNSDTATDSYTLTNADTNAHLSTVLNEVVTDSLKSYYPINNSDIITDATPDLSNVLTVLSTHSSFSDNQTVTTENNDTISESHSSTLNNSVSNPDSLTVLEEPITKVSLSTYPNNNKHTTTEFYKKPVNIEETDTISDLTTVTNKVSTVNSYFNYQVDTTNNSDIIIESYEFKNTDVTPNLSTELSEVTTANDLPSYQIVTLDDYDSTKESYTLFNADVTPVYTTTLDKTTTEVINDSNLIFEFPSELINTEVTSDLSNVLKESSTENSIAINQIITHNDSDVSNDAYTSIDIDVTSDFPILPKDTTDKYFSASKIVTIKNNSTISKSHGLINTNITTDLSTVLKKVTIEDPPSTNLNNDNDAITDSNNISMNIDTTTDLPHVTKELPSGYFDLNNQFATNNESETITESQPIINNELTSDFSTKLENLATEKFIASNLTTVNDTITDYYNTLIDTESTLNQSISEKEFTENSLSSNSFLNNSHITNNSYTLHDIDKTPDLPHIFKEVPSENDNNTDLKAFSTSIHIEYTTAVSNLKENVPYETSTYQSDRSYTNMDSTVKSTDTDVSPEVTTPNVDVTTETYPTNILLDSSLEDYESFFKFSEEDTDFEEIAEDALSIFEQSKRSQVLINSIFDNDEIASNVFDYPELVHNETVI